MRVARRVSRYSLGDGVLVFLGEVDGYTEGHAAGDDGDLVERVGVITQRGDEGVTGLVIGGNLLLFVGEEHRLALGTHHDLVLGYFEVVHVDRLAVVAGGGEGGLVDHVGQVGTGEARGSTSEDVEINVFGHGDLLGVNLEDLFAAADVGPVDDDATVEAAGAEQRGVEHVGPVGGGDEDDAVVGLEAVHLDQKLVERLLTLVVSAAEACATVTADGVDLVDEDDAGAFFLPCSNRSRTRRRRRRRTSRRSRNQLIEKNGTLASPATARARRVLPVPGGPTSSTPLGMRPPRRWNFCGFAEELDDLLELFLGLVNTGDVLEGDLLLLHGEQTGARFAEAHRLVAAGLHLAQKEEPETEEQSEGRELDEEAEPRVRVLIS